MARNSEKAMTTLARWRAYQIELKNPREHRPYLASECTDLKKAERWRRQIISEISRNVATIQNAGLGAFKLRDLNDHINKLLREKKHWEKQIYKLGGRHVSSAPKTTSQGQEVPGSRGYKYFGAVKDLPGVRELFEQAPKPKQKSRSELARNLNTDYYGYRDEDDKELIEQEKKFEKELISQKVLEFQSNNIQTDNPVSSEINYDESYSLDIIVPTKEEMEQRILESKKQELLKKYTLKPIQGEIPKSETVDQV
ncbi:Pre-mRNA-splicing factor ISY1 [Intoshia linei]|uniref:Pre-mRNA-splicing factor ISY1 n=1 Tax=Intoshia linei TaxID=1819745 RepID=A0A177BD20_9BILA|nr:Pre-mRNA-splicing factor ISY1 [Intoshia linei]